MLSKEAEVYLNEMKEKRGYILPMHELFAKYDLEFLKNYNNLFEGVMDPEKGILSRKVQEFVYIAVCITLNSDAKVVQGHINRAIDAGATHEEILQVIQLTAMSFLSKSLSLGTKAHQNRLEEEKQGV